MCSERLQNISRNQVTLESGSWTQLGEKDVLFSHSCLWLLSLLVSNFNQNTLGGPFLSPICILLAQPRRRNSPTL